MLRCPAIPTFLLILIGSPFAAAQPGPFDARGFLERGRAHYRNGEYDKAIADYDVAIRLDPANASAFLSRGCAFGQKGEWDSAIKDYDAAIRLNPKDAWAWYNRGYARTKTEDWSRADDDLSEAINLDPKSALAFYNRAVSRSQRKFWDRAIEDYTAAIRLDPLHARAYSGRGECLRMKREWESAIRDAEEGVRLAPKDAYVVDARGRLWMVLGEWGKAIEDFTTAIRLDLHDPLMYARRAMIRAACPDPKYRDGRKAIDDATRACDRSRWKDPYYLAAYAAANAELGDFAEAVRWQKEAVAEIERQKLGVRGLREALALYEAKKPHRPGKTDAAQFVENANYWYQKAEWDKVILRCTAATHFDAGNARAFYLLGCARDQKGESERAIEHFTEAIRLQPRNAEAHNSRGVAWKAKGEWQRALQDYDEAVRLDPGLTSALVNRAFLRAACPDPKYRDGPKAVDDARRALELTEPKEMKGFYLPYLAAAYAESGDFDAAVKWQKKALEDPVYSKSKAFADEGRKALKLYEAKQPYRFEKK